MTKINYRSKISKSSNPPSYFRHSDNHALNDIGLRPEFKHRVGVCPLSAEEYEVTVSTEPEQRFVVLLSDEYYKRVTSLNIGKKQFIEFSIAFVLTRLTPNAIRHVFNVSLIPKHFPEFESEVKFYCENKKKFRV